MSTPLRDKEKIASLALRQHELTKRTLKGAVPVDEVLLGLQRLIEGRFNVTNRSRTFEEMVLAGKYDSVDDRLRQLFTTDAIVLNQERLHLADVTLDMPMRVSGPSEILDHMTRSRRMPGTIETLLAYGEEESDFLYPRVVIALGQKLTIRGEDERYASISTMDGRRRLGLIPVAAEIPFHSKCGFLSLPMSVDQE